MRVAPETRRTFLGDMVLQYMLQQDQIFGAWDETEDLKLRDQLPFGKRYGTGQKALLHACP